ncbi:MAG TPA: hypothetical protein VF796_29755 [Humisphaera sp.]
MSRRLITTCLAAACAASGATILAAPATRPAATRHAATRPATQPAGKPGTAFAVPGHGALELNVPAGWKAEIVQPPGLPPTIRVEMPGPKGFSLQMTALPPRGDPAFNAPERLKQIAERQGQRVLSGSVEKELAVQTVKGEQATACLYTLTDKAPNPGAFEYMTSGVVGVGDLLIPVTFLHHQKDTPERTAAIEMLRTARQRPADPPAAELRARPPGNAGWEVVLPLPGLTVMDEQTDPTGTRRRIAAGDAKAGVMVTIFLEPAEGPGGAAAVRDVYWGKTKQSPLPKADVVLAEAGDFATVQHVVPDVGGRVVNQRNLNLYAARGGVWVDVHVSKMNATDADKALFDRLAKETRIEAVKEPGKK